MNELEQRLVEEFLKKVKEKEYPDTTKESVILRDLESWLKDFASAIRADERERVTEMLNSKDYQKLIKGE